MELQRTDLVPVQQSRLDKRAHQIALLEDDYAIAKATYERTLSLRYYRLMKAIRAEIKPLAKQQVLDRKILRKLYTLNYLEHNLFEYGE